MKSEIEREKSFLLDLIEEKLTDIEYFKEEIARLGRVKEDCLKCSGLGTVNYVAMGERCTSNCSCSEKE